jgi:hypothetical protein
MSVGLTLNCADPRCSESIHIVAVNGADLAFRLRTVKRTKKGDLIWRCPRCAKRLARKQRYARRTKNKKHPVKG